MAADERKTAKRELADELRQLKIELAELAPIGPFSVAGRPRTGGGQQ